MKIQKFSLPMIGFFQALGLAAYCGLVGILFWKGNEIFGKVPNYWGPFLDLKKAGEPERAKLFMRFFKTGKGEYGEGDLFLGITVPKTREIAKKYKDISLKDLQKLLSSKIHEHRLC